MPATQVYLSTRVSAVLLLRSDSRVLSTPVFDDRDRGPLRFIRSAPREPVWDSLRSTTMAMDSTIGWIRF